MDRSANLDVHPFTSLGSLATIAAFSGLERKWFRCLFFVAIIGYVLLHVNMNTEPTTATVKRRLRRKLAAMGEEQPFIIGSLTKIHRRCGNPNCRCAGENGQKHPAHLLTTKIKGKTHAIYVPVDMVDEVQGWCCHYRVVKAQIKDVSECCEQLIRMHAKDKQSRTGKKRTTKQS